jgi:EAL domain-containing protein (putative c-di-GMP-specific phosphodiesterase class I)
MMVQTIILLANRYFTNIIAEGVETHAQPDLLMKMGCTLYQGYFFGKPLPIAKFEEAFFDLYYWSLRKSYCSFYLN